MNGRTRNVAPREASTSSSFGWGLLLGVVTALALAGAPAFGQTDTTKTAPADTVGSSQEDEPLPPERAPRPVHGRAVVDSLPARSPVTGMEHVLAQRPGSFLYDLGAVGWPHGWSADGLAPHRSQLWIGDRPYDDPVLGRPRFDLLPVSFLRSPRSGFDPGGGGIGIHTSWRSYDRGRPITELRFQDDSNGLQAVEVGHSQNRQLELGGSQDLLKISFGFGGRATNNAYASSDLRSERRLWGRLRYQQEDWGVELLDLSSRHRIGTQGGVRPLQDRDFRSVFFPDLTEENVRNAEASRRTFRNDLTARAWGPLFPGLEERTSISATWTSNTFDFDTGVGQSAFGTGGDTTLTVKTNGFHGALQQSLTSPPHNITVGLRGSAWRVARSNVPAIEGTRWSAHAFVRDSLRAGSADLLLDAGVHNTVDQTYYTTSVRGTDTIGHVQISASFELTGQQTAWIERSGFADFVTPLPDAPSSQTDRVLKGSVGARTHLGAFDIGVRGFGHQIQGAVDLFAEPPSEGQHTDSVVVRQTSSPVQRLGATVSLGWRRSADEGLYFTGQTTALTTLNEDESSLHARLGRALPDVFARGRLGARFVLFQDLGTDFYVQGRAWTEMNGRWFHPPTGRLVVPPLDTPIPDAPSSYPRSSWTADVHAELSLRSATLFFTLENVQAQTELQSGTFIVPVFPLPARQFRFGIFWPIFD